MLDFFTGFAAFVYYYASNYTVGNYAGNNWTGGKAVTPGEPGEFLVWPVNPTDAAAKL